MRRAWRFPIVVLVPALLVAAIVVQQRAESTQTVDAELLDPAQLLPVAQRAGVASSTFFCAGGTATGKSDGFAEHTVTVANLSGDRRTGTLTVYFDKADPVVKPIEVGAHSRFDTKLSDVGKADYASAVVEMPGGEIAVEHSVSGPTGRAVSTCASSPSNRWYFPAGSTRPGARLVLAVFNPFPDSAVLDLTFETDDGARTPGPFNPLVVPGGRVTGVDVTGVVTLRRQLSTTIVTRSGSGRVVVDQLQSFDGKDTPVGGGTSATPGTTTPSAVTGTTIAGGGSSAPVRDRGVRGLTLALGAPVPVSTWLFPEGPPLAEGVDEQYIAMNPGLDPVVVDVQLHLDDQDRTGPVEPYEATIRPGQYAVVSLNQDNRVPTGVGHWATITSRGGPVVAARVVTAIDPAPSKGYSLTLGSPVVATTWLVAAADLADTADAVVTIVNPSAATAQISVYVSSQGQSTVLDRYDRVDLAPGARTVAPVGQRKAGTAVSVSVVASQPVLVEQRVAFDASSFSSVLGEPVVGTLALPAPGQLAPSDSEPAPPGTGPLLDLGDSGTTIGTVPPGSGTTETTGTSETTESDATSSTETTSVDGGPGGDGAATESTVAGT